MRKPDKKLDQKNIENILALTPMQEGMLFHYLKETPYENQGQEQNYLYFEQLSFEISGPVDETLFKKTCSFITQSNPMLRTLFRWEKVAKPVQIILKDHEPDTRFLDFSLSPLNANLNVNQKRTEIRQKDKKEPFHLSEVPFRITLCKWENQKATLIFSNHHILYDGWSNGILLKEFFQTYETLANNNTPQPLLKTGFQEFIKWQGKRNATEEAAFWQKALEGFDSPTPLPVKQKTVPPTIDLTGAPTDDLSGEQAVDQAPQGHLRITLGKDMETNLETFTRQHRITQAAFLYTVWGLLLQKYTNSDDVIAGTTVSGRPSQIKGIEEIIGLFINTLPLRFRSQPRGNALALLQQTELNLRNREPHEHTPLTGIKEYAHIDSPEELFDTIMVVENYPLDKRFLVGRDRSIGNSDVDSNVSSNVDSTVHLAVDSYHMEESAHYDLTLVISLFDGIHVDFMFNRQTLAAETVEGMGRHFRNIAGEMLQNPLQQTANMEILSPEEKRWLLEECNDTAIPYPSEKTIQLLFEEHVEKTPYRTALVGPSIMSDSSTFFTLTYQELNQRAETVTSHLMQLGVIPGTGGIIGIMTERSIEMIIAILGVLKAGAAYLPIDPKYPAERINFMLSDSDTKLLLTSRLLPQSPIPPLYLEDILYTHPMKVETHNGSESPKHSRSPKAVHIGGPGGAAPWRSPRRGPRRAAGGTELVYIMYTSGSTGRPKGVMNTHANVTRIALNTNYAHFTGDDRFLLISNYAFDGSVIDTYGSLLNGGVLVLMPPAETAEIDRLEEMVKKEQITVFFATTAFFNLLADERPGILKSLGNLFFGGDSASPEHCRKALLYSGKGKLVQGYGPTETAVFATYYNIDDVPPQADAIPIGKALANTSVYILDRHMKPMPIGVPGEIYIGGSGTALGYLNRPQLTAQTFLPNPFVAGDRLYKTGDLGVRLPDGNIHFHGRIDFQVKIRGFRIEPGEIENRLKAHHTVGDALVLVYQRGDEGPQAAVKKSDKSADKYICAYVVPAQKDQKTPHMTQWQEYLAASLPEYMIPAHIIPLQTFPLTANGKIDRKRLPLPETYGSAQYQAPRNDLEKKLAEIWANVLGINSSQIGIKADFFSLGGHSLKATTLTLRIHKELEVRVPVDQVFKTPTIEGLSNYINTSTTASDGTKETDFPLYPQVQPVEKKEYYPLSRNQESFFMLHYITGSQNSVAFNAPMVLPLEGDVDKTKVENIFFQLIRRHDSLRTSFFEIAGKPVQRAHNRVRFSLQYDELPGIESPEKSLRDLDWVSRFVRPFDLQAAPLIRAGLLKTEPGKYLLVMDMHHIITDGTSESILSREFLSLYHGDSPLPPVQAQYIEFAAWQKDLEKSQTMAAHETFWKQLLSADIPLLDMPTDFPRPSRKTFDGDSFSFYIDPPLSRRIRALCREEGMTLYMVTLTALNILLHKSSGQRDIIIGSPVAGRVIEPFQNTVGLLMDSILLRNAPSGEKTVHRFLQEVKQTTLEAFRHKDYPLELLVNQVPHKTPSNRTPFSDVALTVLNMFDHQSLQKVNRKASAGDSRPAAHEAYLHRTSKVDFTFSLVETPEGEFPCILEYNTALFKPDTMERLSQRFRQVLLEMTANSDLPLCELDMFSPREKLAISGGVHRFFPLSHPQKRIYYTEKTYPGTAANILAFTFRYNEILDKKRLQRAIAIFLSRHDSLRLRIVEPQGCPEPYQYLESLNYQKSHDGQNDHDGFNKALPILPELLADGDEKGLEDLLEKKSRQPMPLLNHKLVEFVYLRFNDRESGYYVRAHHIVFDGFSSQVLAAQIECLYRQLEKGPLPGDQPQQPRQPSYIDFVRSEVQYLDSPQGREDRDFWRGSLLPLPEPAPLSYAKGNPLDIEGDVAVIPLPREIVPPMSDFCRKQHTSIYKVIFAALALTISRAARTHDLVIAGAGHNRSTSAEKQITGMFVSTLPIRVNVDEEKPFESLVNQVGESINEIVKKHQRYPFDLLARGIRRETGQDAGFLLDINFVGHGVLPDTPYRIIHHFPGSEPTPLTIHLNPLPGGQSENNAPFELEWNYQKKRYRPEEINNLHTCLMTLLANSLKNPDAPMKETELLPPAEKERILYRFNDTGDHFSPTESVVETFHRQAAQTPEAVALKDGEHCLTYRLLQDRVRDVTKRLKASGIVPGSIVALLLGPSVEMIFSLWGILEAGAAYLPIDPAYPDERIRYMLEDSGARLLITTRDHSGQLLFAGEYFYADQGFTSNLPPRALRPPAAEKTTQSQPHQPGRPGDTAYIIYTSGTTGKPKGVMVEHRNLTAYLNAFNRQFHLTPEDVMLQQASYAFDAFVEEFYPIQLIGGTLAIAQKEEIKDIHRLARFIARNRVTALTVSPLLLDQLNKLEQIHHLLAPCASGGPPGALRGRLRGERQGEAPPGPPICAAIGDLPCGGDSLPLEGSDFNGKVGEERKGQKWGLRILISGGDVLKPRYVRKLAREGGVYNTYGPTETTVCATYYRCPAQLPQDIPIGKPIANYRVYILDKQNRVQPVGIAGEICISGPGVTRGYLNRPQLTSEKFISFPPTLQIPETNNGSASTKPRTSSKAVQSGGSRGSLPLALPA